MTSSRTAVILFNLGGPDSRRSIIPFLFRFFMDPNIISAPLPVRFFLAVWIALTRGLGAAKSSYAELGFKSPLLENTRAQAQALEECLNKQNANDIFRVFVCMRYWHPMAREVARAVKAWGADRLILLPLYPQFSTTTSFSALQAWKTASEQEKLCIPSEAICCYPENTGFIQASAHHIRAAITQIKQDHPDFPVRVLFSAHGLPEKIIQGGDPYQWQCEQSASAIAHITGLAQEDWTLCYQSRVGPLTWIGPDIQTELERAARDHVAVVVYPHAFVNEHVETLVELDIEYRHVAQDLGIPAYVRVQTVGTSPAFIESLANLVMRKIGIQEKVSENEEREKITSGTGSRICPESFGRCCMAQKNEKSLFRFKRQST